MSANGLEPDLKATVNKDIQGADTGPGRRVSVAPMMERTDRHDRVFLRLLSRHTLLYSEMIPTGAIVHGRRTDLLVFDSSEHPVALQVGGADPAELAECARIATAFGYDEINLNVGCPSNRVQNARFGACLMAEPGVVADGVRAMGAAGPLPVTVKCRIGIDERESATFWSVPNTRCIAGPVPIRFSKPYWRWT